MRYALVLHGRIERRISLHHPPRGLVYRRGNESGIGQGGRAPLKESGVVHEFPDGVAVGQGRYVVLHHGKVHAAARQDYVGHGVVPCGPYAAVQCHAAVRQAGRNSHGGTVVD